MAQEKGSDIGKKLGGIMEKVSPAQIEKHLTGIDFPVGKRDLIMRAREKNVPEEVIKLLDRLPDREYGSASEVTKQFGESEKKSESEW